MAVEESYSDQELIAALSRKENSNQAILYIYKQYHSTISSFIIAKGGTQQDAEDVFQATFLILARKANIELVERDAALARWASDVHLGAEREQCGCQIA